MQRGFRQYGQPCDETINSIVDIIEDDDDAHFANHEQRLCTWGCEHWSDIPPHSVRNWKYQCMEANQLNDNDKLKMGLYEDWNCAWSECFGMPTHRIADCMYFCQTSKYRKLIE